MLDETMWKAERRRAKTDEWTARRLLSDGKTYAEMEARQEREMRIRQLFILEALLAHGGNQTHTAQAIGVSRATINKALRALELSHEAVVALADEVGGK